MTPLRFPNPIASSATVDARRRLLLPKALGLSSPVLLIELADGDEVQLGVSNSASVEVMRSEGMNPNVLLESKSLRITIPRKVCAAHSLVSASKVFLVTMDCWIPIWSEVNWIAEIAKARFPSDF